MIAFRAGKVNILKLTQKGLHFAYAIFKYMSFNEILYGSLSRNVELT